MRNFDLELFAGTVRALGSFPGLFGDDAVVDLRDGSVHGLFIGSSRCMSTVVGFWTRGFPELRPIPPFILVSEGGLLLPFEKL